MISTLLNKLNAKEVIENNLHEIINTFSTYYNIDYKEVEKKFNNMFVAPYYDIEELETLIAIIKSDLSYFLYDRLLKVTNFSNQELRIYFNINNNGVGYISDNLPIARYKKFIEWYNMSSEEKLYDKEECTVSFFKQYFPNVTLDSLYSIKDTEMYNELVSNDSLKDIVIYYIDNSIPNIKYEKVKSDAVSLLVNIYPDITIDNIEFYKEQGKLNRIDEILRYYEIVLKIFDKEVSKLKRYTDFIEQYKTYDKILEKEYNEKLLYEFKDYIVNNVYEDYKNNRYNKFSNLYIGNCNNLDYFSLENEYKISAGNWESKLIIEHRINYFKKLGIDLGNNYELYMNNDKCKNLLPPQYIIEKIVQKRKQYRNEKSLKLFNISKINRNIKKEIDRLNLLSKDDGYDIDTLYKIPACIVPNVKLIDGIPNIYSIFLFTLNIPDEYLDVTIIHELNHLFELFLLSIKDDSIEFVCGWDCISKKYANAPSVENVDTKRDYELLNEIINQLIAQDITKFHHERGKYIFNSNIDSKLYGGILYEMYSDIVIDFFDEYKQDILLSRRDGNINHIFNIVGKDNFDSLNILCKEYYNTFTNIAEKMNAKNDLEIGIESERAKKYEKLIMKKDEIMCAMRIYNKQNKKVI